MSTPGERLKAAIKLAGYKKLAPFAEVAGVDPGTLRQQIARDSIPKDAADLYVRKLRRVGVTLEWLMFNRGAGPGGVRPVLPDIVPDDGHRATVPIRHYVGAGDMVHLIDDDSPLGDTAAPPGYEKGSAVVVRGESMMPIFQPGDVLFFRLREDPPKKELPLRAVIVQLTDGPLYLKKLLPGTKRGLFHLISVNPTTQPILDANVESIARVGWVKPAD
jgi:hypothetical protein